MRYISSTQIFCRRCQRLCFRRFASYPDIRRVTCATGLHHWRFSCRLFVRHLSSLKKRDYYDVLGVTRSATQQTIKEAYISQSKKLHPDRSTHHQTSSTSSTVGSHDKFVELQEAYSVLRNPSTRTDYDIRSRQEPSENETQSRTESSRSYPYEYEENYQSYQNYRYTREKAKWEKAWEEYKEYSEQARPRKSSEYKSSDASKKMDSEPLVGLFMMYTTLSISIGFFVLCFVGIRMGQQKKKILQERQKLYEDLMEQKLSFGVVQSDNAVLWSQLQDFDLFKALIDTQEDPQLSMESDLDNLQFPDTVRQEKQSENSLLRSF